MAGCVPVSGPVAVAGCASLWGTVAGSEVGAGDADPGAGEETTAVCAVELVHEATPTSADTSTHTHSRVELLFTAVPVRRLRALLPG